MIAMLRSFLDPRQLGYLILYVTNRCNFRCRFCFLHEDVAKGRKSDELTLEELTRVSRTVGPLLQLSITGGEPFLREDLAEITGEFVASTRVRYVTIPTNAWFTDRIVATMEAILSRHPQSYFRLVFSVDGIGDQHDHVRSMPGSYARIVQSYNAVSPLRSRFPNLVLDANSIYSAETEESIVDTVTCLDDTFRFDNISVTYTRGDVKSPELKAMSAKRYVELNRCLEGLKRKKESRFLYPIWRGVRDVSRQNLMRTVFDDEFVGRCVAGRKLAVLRETGEVYACEMLSRSMGNVRDFDYNLTDVLKSEAGKGLVKWIRDTKCKCSFECALGANVVWNPSHYPKLCIEAVKNIGRYREP